MSFIPAKLPLWAYLAVGAVAFVIAKAAAAGAGTSGPDDAAAAGAPLTGGGSGSVWDQFGGGGAMVGGGLEGGQFGGNFPVSDGGSSLSDLLGGQPLPVTITDTYGNPITFPSGGGSDGGTTTTPSPTPAPAYSIQPVGSQTPVTSTSSPSSPATSTSSWPAGATGHVSVKAGTYRMYTVSSGRITGYVTFNTGGFSAYTCCHATYPWPSVNSQRILVKLISGSRAGGFFSPVQTGVTYTAK